MSYLPHQNAESGISGPRKFLDTFKMSHHKKPLGMMIDLMKECVYYKLVDQHSSGYVTLVVSCSSRFSAIWLRSF